MAVETTGTENVIPERMGSLVNTSLLVDGSNVSLLQRVRLQTFSSL